MKGYLSINNISQQMNAMKRTHASVWLPTSKNQIKNRQWKGQRR